MSEELSQIIVLPSLPLEMTFEDREPIEIPIKIKGRDGLTRKYLLKEGMEEVNCKYQNFINNQYKLGTDGSMMSIGNMADAEPYLIHLCLYELIPSKDNPDIYQHKQVSLAVVRSWPSDRIKVLYEKAKQINHIDDNDTLETLYKQKDRIEKRIAELEAKEKRLKNE